jgi:hypothetical protein
MRAHSQAPAQNRLNSVRSHFREAVGRHFTAKDIPGVSTPWADLPDKRIAFPLVEQQQGLTPSTDIPLSARNWRFLVNESMGVKQIRGRTKWG